MSSAIILHLHSSRFQPNLHSLSTDDLSYLLQRVKPYDVNSLNNLIFNQNLSLQSKSFSLLLISLLKTMPSPQPRPPIWRYFLTAPLITFSILHRLLLYFQPFSFFCTKACSTSFCLEIFRLLRHLSVFMSPIFNPILCQKPSAVLNIFHLVYYIVCCISNKAF